MDTDASELVLKHFPTARRDVPKGFSSWQLKRADDADWKYPTRRQLGALFRTASNGGELYYDADYRFSWGCLVCLPAGVSKATRQCFLAGVAKHRSTRLKTAEPATTE
jgi:hypothetical protein